MQFLSHISKEYGNSPTLGQEFTQAITETILSKSNLCTMLRVSMVAANLSTNRVVDGVSKLITKTDVASLKAKKFQEKLLQVEQFLAELWGMSQESEAARTIRYKSFGKAAIRTILALLAKEKLGREPNHQYNHQQIRDAMLKDLQQQPNYIPRSKINDEPKEPASKSCGTLVNLDQSKDAMFVASQSLAIQVGSAYTHKDFAAKVWELVESNQEGVKLAHKPLFQPQQTAHEIQASMKASKAKCPKLLNQALVEKLLPTESPMVSQELAKCKIFIQLVECYNNQDLDANDFFVQEQPQQAVYASKDLKKGYVQLIPCPDRIGCITNTKPSGTKYGEVKLNGQSWFVLPAKSFKGNGDHYTGMLSPYWTCCHNDDNGQLTEKWVTHGELHVKVLINQDAITKHELIALKPPPRPEDTDVPRKKKARTQ